MKLLEVCCGDADSVAASAIAGAERIELCSALAVGGVTPSAGLMSAARKIFKGRIHVLIRPREGDFVYTQAEKDVMIDDIGLACKCGCDGVVVGALLPDGRIDCGFAALAASTARRHGLSVTFHRAFDQCTDKAEALDALIGMGYDRVLTSGGAESAEEGVDMLASLVAQSSGRIIILPGGGVTAANAARICNATGATEIHGSCRLGGGRSSDASIITLIMQNINHE